MDVGAAIARKAMVIALAVTTACAGRPQPKATDSIGEIVLFRDGAVVRQAIAYEAAGSATTTLRARIPAGVATNDVIVLERGTLAITVREIASAESADATAPSPTTLEIVIAAPPRGRHVLHLAYVTDRISWQAAYTMTTTTARDRVQVRGALAIANATGLDLAMTKLALVDTELDIWRGKLRDDLVVALVGMEPFATSMPIRRAIGRIALRSGETRVELLPNDPPRVMRSVLVYDPFGTALDHNAEIPLADPELGTRASTRVTESFEIVRDASTNAGLPAGRVRLLERRADGSLAVLGEARAFEAASRVAEVDTVTLGTAIGVTARRERVEFTIDELAKRATEEFAITIENTRPVPVDVVLREHQYRGLNWQLAFFSTPVVQEGNQQFSMRTRVPANGRAKTVHVVVYWWKT